MILVIDNYVNIKLLSRNPIEVRESENIPMQQLLVFGALNSIVFKLQN